MDRFENKIIKGVHASRYIASWVRSGGSLKYRRDDFREWLALEGLTEEEIDHVDYLAHNGRLELEDSSKKFLKERNESKDLK